MKQVDRIKALTIITEVQSTCSAVVVKIGSVTSEDQVKHDTLSIIDCPAAVVNYLKGEGFTLSMCNGELSVNKY